MISEENVARASCDQPVRLAVVAGADEIIRQIQKWSGPARIIDEGVHAGVLGGIEQMKVQDVGIPVPVPDRGEC